MRIVDIIWLPHIIDKLATKHRVTPEEVDEVFLVGRFIAKYKKDTFLARMGIQL